ncbi:MAG: hypothetical protein KAU62_14820 [Candidatus Heimdallarchaeota archaeon]|nr:hypothetical protein [Candidatus Heimdallarchaeota archaeon]MCK4612425.1 hypothetical protein [Candidatus Heimdallarchaeota archaeon]
MQKDRLLQRIFIGLIVITVLTNLLFVLAIHYYPGGNFLDPADEGFDFLYGAMSDLGRITAYNGESNTISRFLYTTALESASHLCANLLFNNVDILSKEKNYKVVEFIRNSFRCSSRNSVHYFRLFSS